MKHIAVVTGGSEGIGKAIITSLIHEHWTVINFARNTRSGEATAAELGCQFKTVDVGNYEGVEIAMQEVLAEHGQIDALINNAGLWIQGPLDENDPERMREVILANTLGVLNVSRAALPAMKAAKQGTIVNISSSAGLIAKPDMSTYDASKWGVTGLSKALQLELSPFGIRVTCVYPGKVETKLFESAGNHKTFEDAIKPEDVARAVQFVLDQPAGVNIPDLSIRHL